MNYFKIFEIEEKFAIDLDNLEKKYLDFQSEFHPDKAGVDEIDKSMQVNESYKNLSDDFLRAAHLLKLKNVDILTDEKAVSVDKETLTKVWELQEVISEITDENEKKEIKTKLNSEIKLLISAGVKCIENNDIELAAQLLVKAKYLKKSVSDLKKK